MKPLCILTIILTFALVFSLVPVYANQAEFSLRIDAVKVINEPTIDFGNVTENTTVVITDITSIQEIKIPPQLEIAKIRFEGDAILNNTVQIQNDLAIEAENINAVIEIKSQTSIKNDNWDGEFIFSKTNNEVIADQENTVSFQIGSDLVSLDFEPPIKITFKDSANKNLFVTSAGKGRAQIETICTFDDNSNDVSTVNNIPTTYPKSCYINAGNDLITITAQASVFSTSNDASPSSSTSTQPSSTKSSGGGNHGKSPSSSVCGGVLCTDASKKDTLAKQTESTTVLKETEDVLPDVNQNPWSDLSLKTQIKNGIPIELLECRNGLELFLKQTTLTPVCISNSTAEKLIQRDWITRP